MAVSQPAVSLPTHSIMKVAISVCVPRPYKVPLSYFLTNAGKVPALESFCRKVIVKFAARSSSGFEKISD